MGKKHKPEDITGKWREAEIVWCRAGWCRMPADCWGLQSSPITAGARSVVCQRLIWRVA